MSIFDAFQLPDTAAASHGSGDLSLEPETAEALEKKKDILQLQDKGSGHHGESMPLTGHLDELRKAIIFSVIALCVATLVAFPVVEPVILALQHVAPKGSHFIQLNPGETLGVFTKVLFLAGGLLSSPVLLFLILQFILPGLTQKERQVSLAVTIGGGLLFVLGMWFSYAFVLPPTLDFLFGFSTQWAQLQLSISAYMDFCLMILILMGVVFELPLVLVALAATGLVRSQQLKAHWRTIVVMIFVASAILTPSQDPYSMIVVAVALTALYALSIIPIQLMGK